MNQAKVTQAIENICSEGCIRVNEIIAELEKGSTIRQTEELSQEETRLVLMELKTIMSVYRKKD